MFHFPTFPPNTLYIQVRVTGHISSRVSPFGNPRITARLPAPRGLSQAPTSFIGSWCQGIHRAPLKTYQHTTKTQLTQKQRCSRPLYSSQATGRKQPHTPTPTRHTIPGGSTSKAIPATRPHHTPPKRGGPTRPAVKQHAHHRTSVPAPSGPNSVPKPPHTTPTPFQPHHPSQGTRSY